MLKTLNTDTLVSLTGELFMPEEKRCYERYAADMMIWARPFGEGGDFNLVETTDVSAGGLRFIFHRNLENGSWLELRLELPRASDLVDTTARVCHVCKEDDLFHVGVEFTDVKNYSVPVLMGYLETIYK
jgi:hypothetical protein